MTENLLKSKLLVFHIPLTLQPQIPLSMNQVFRRQCIYTHVRYTFLEPSRERHPQMM